MGDTIIDDGDLVVTYGGESSDTDSGQLIISDVTVGLNRDNTTIHGLSTNEPQALSHGNKTYELSFEGMIDQSLADVIRDQYQNDTTVSGSVYSDTSDGAPQLKASIGKIDWNSIEISGSDGGDVTISLDADCREVDLSTDY